MDDTLSARQSLVGRAAVMIDSSLEEIDKISINNILDDTIKNSKTEIDINDMSIDKYIGSYFLKAENCINQAINMLSNVMGHVNLDVKHVSNNLSSISEWIDSNTKENKIEWNTSSRKCYYICLSSIILATLIELMLSYKLLTVNIPAFNKNKLWAAFFGLVPLMLAVVLKFITLLDWPNVKKNFGKAGTVSFFLWLQYIVYNIQVGDTKFETTTTGSTLDAYASADAGGLLLSGLKLNYEALLYFFASTTVFAFVYIMTSMSLQIYRKNANPKSRSVEWINLKKLLTGFQLVETEAKSHLSRAQSSIAAINNKKLKMQADFARYVNEVNNKISSNLKNIISIKADEIRKVNNRISSMYDKLSDLRGRITDIDKTINNRIKNNDINSLREELKVLENKLSEEMEFKSRLELELETLKHGK